MSRGLVLRGQLQTWPICSVMRLLASGGGGGEILFQEGWHLHGSTEHICTGDEVPQLECGVEAKTKEVSGELDATG
jgi:hypothetical protein